MTLWPPSPRGRPLWPTRTAKHAVDVVGLGECSIDHACRLDGPPPLAGKAAMLDYAVQPGGQVATALLACVRLGLRAGFVGSVGDDPAGRLVLEPLRSAGIDLSHVRSVANARTRLAVILVDNATGERTILWHRDPRLKLPPELLPRALIEGARALLLDAGDPEAGLRAAHLARAQGVPVILDADEPTRGLDELLARVDFPIVSQGFAEKFSHGGSPRAALKRLVELGARLAVVTLGERGALAREGERELVSPGYAVAAVDTTGAGDVFRAAFVWALLAGFDAEGALRAANAAAVLSCRGAGAQGALPTQQELDDFLNSHKPGPWRDPER